MLAHRGFQGLRRSSEDILDVRRQPVIRVGGVQMPHRQQMFEDVLRQMASAQFFGPRLDRHVDIGDLAPQCLAVLGGEGVQILRTPVRSARKSCRCAARDRAGPRRSLARHPGRPPETYVPNRRAAGWCRRGGYCSAAQGRKNGSFSWNTVGRTWTSGKPDQFKACSPSQRRRCCDESAFSGCSFGIPSFATC